jgi:hypothetical protein
MMKMRENGFLAGKRYSGPPPPPPSLNVDRPGGSGIEPGSLIYLARSRPSRFARFLFTIPDPPLVKFRKVGGALELM